MKSRTRKVAYEMEQSCLNMRARYLSRVLSGIYDDELRPLGVKSSQLNLLATIACAGPIRRSEIGAYLHLDSSTLTRNLRVMEINGWIEDVAAGSDGRGLPVQLTSKGQAIIEEAEPAWRAAQKRADHLLRKGGNGALMALTDGLRQGTI